MYGLLTKCEVRDGWILAKFSFLRVYAYGPRRSRGPQARKKGRGQYQNIKEDIPTAFWGLALLRNETERHKEIFHENIHAARE